MKKGLFAFKVVIFVLGLILIALAAFLIKPGLDSETWRNIFMWCQIGLVYLAFVFPVTIASGFPKDAGRTFVAGGIYFTGAIVFTILTAGVAVLVKIVRVSTPIAVLAQCALVIILLVYIFLACVTSEHIGTVQKQEDIKKAQIDMLRTKANNLVIRASVLDDSHADVKQALQQFADDFRYLSPSKDPTAIEIERRMLMIVDQMGLDPIFSAPNAGDASIKKLAQQLTLLCTQRKGIY